MSHYTADRPPQVHERVRIHNGRFNGRSGAVREVDSAAKKVRVWSPGLLSQETVLLNWSDITPLQ